MQYNGEMPFLTFITITGNPSIISSSVFTLSIAFGSIWVVIMSEILLKDSSIFCAPHTVPSSLIPI